MIGADRRAAKIFGEPGVCGILCAEYDSVGARFEPCNLETTVLASIDYTLAAFINRLELTGSAANGFGNGLADRIPGNGRNNILRGEAGTDTLDGGGGSREIDRLNGGANADTFILGDGSRRNYDDGLLTTPGLDGYAIIEDFTPSQSDRLRLTGSASRYFLAVSPIPGLAGISLYHDSNGDSVPDPEADELIAILISTETLTVGPC